MSTTQDLSSPGEVMRSLEALEAEMAESQNPYEKAAYWADIYTHQWEHRMAICAVKAQGSNETQRKAHAFVMAVEMDDLFQRYSEATAAFNAHRRAQDTRRDRATIKMSILRGQGRG